MTDGLDSRHPAAELLTTKHDFYKSWFLVADELGYNKGVLCGVANGKRNPSKKLIDRMNEVYGCHLHVKTIKVTVPVCPMCDKAYEPKHRCASEPPVVEVEPCPTCGTVTVADVCPVCNPPRPKRKRGPDRVIRVNTLSKRIDALHFSREVKDEIRRGLMGV